MLETLDETLALVGGGDGTMALDHEIVFVSTRCTTFHTSYINRPCTDERGPELPNRSTQGRSRIVRPAKHVPSHVDA